MSKLRGLHGTRGNQDTHIEKKRTYPRNFYIVSIRDT